MKKVYRVYRVHDNILFSTNNDVEQAGRDLVYFMYQNEIRF